MTHEEYIEGVKIFTNEMKSVTGVKNLDYSAGKDEAMESFYSIANRSGITPIQAWFVLVQKHVQAIERFVKTGKLTSEPIHSRFIDLANYAMLGSALVEDLEKKSKLN